MRAVATIVACVVWAMPLAEYVSAQPVLNRVERFLRDQVNALQGTTNGSPAAEPGYLGITADDRSDLGRGVRIVSVRPASPAEQAGLASGDLITAIDDRPVRLMSDVAAALSGKPAGTKVAVMIDRAGTQQQHEVTLGQRPGLPVASSAPITLPPPPATDTVETLPAPRPRLGVRTIPVDAAVRQQNNLPTDQGATVVSVTVGSPAEQAGIPLGAVITAVDQQPIESPGALAKAINAAGDVVALTYYEQGRPIQRQVPLHESVVDTDDPSVQLRARPVNPPTELPGPAGTPTPAIVPPENESQDNASRVAELEGRIAELEARIKNLEQAQTPSPDEE